MSMMRVNIQQLENSIRLMTATLDIHERRRHAWLEFGKREREVWGAFLQIEAYNCGQTAEHFAMQQVGSTFKQMIERWQQQHKVWYELQAQIYELDIAHLKSAIAIEQAKLKEATEPSIELPGGRKIESN